MAHVKKHIVRIYCDVPMARSKGFLGKCKYNCRGCFCCIEVDDDGEREHVNPMSMMTKKYSEEAKEYMVRLQEEKERTKNEGYNK